MKKSARGGAVLGAVWRRCAAADVSFKLLQDTGMPCEEILRESRRYDLVLFGHETHFRFGSVDRPDETLWHVLKRETRPVVIAPPKLEPGSSVVVAYNGSPQADRALQTFQSSGLDLAEEVCVLSTDDDRRGGRATGGKGRRIPAAPPHQGGDTSPGASGFGKSVDSGRGSTAQCPLARDGSLWAFHGA